MSASRLVAPGARRTGDRPLSEPTAAQRFQVLVLGALIVAVAVTSAIAALANPPVDEWLLETVRGWSWVTAISWLGGATRWPVLGVASALVVLGGGRCRTWPFAALGSLFAAAGIGWLLTRLAHRPLPVESPTGGSDSYPSLPLLVLTVAVGLAYTALVPSMRRRTTWVLVPLTLLVLGSGLVEIHQGSRRPLDVLGATLIGAGVVTLCRLLLEEPSHHPWCQTCRWQREATAARPVAPIITLDATEARLLHRVTLSWVSGLVTVFALLAMTTGMPRSPESGVMGDGLEVPLQWSVLGIMVFGVVLARRHHLAGTSMVVLAAAVLGYASSVQYPPWVSLVVTTATAVPAVLLWLGWHQRASLRSALVASVVAAIVLAAVVGASAATYSYFWGPTHPRSATTPPNADVVAWMWVGGVTPFSADVRLRTAEPATHVRLLVSRHPDLLGAVPSGSASPDADHVVALEIHGLQPDTRYYYAAEVDGDVERERVQSFRTFPAGASSFLFAVGSCQLSGSNGRVFDAIAATQPLFMLSTGDWTYGNIEHNDPARFREQYELNLTAPAQAALYSRAPIAYVWGDHDYGGNDADRTSPSRPAAMRAYRQLVPHYPLAKGPEAPIYQAFTVGRVRFLLTDTRSARDPAGASNDRFRSTLGQRQRGWLLAELAKADRFSLVVWVNPDPWVARARAGADNWGGFARERRIIADALADQDVDNLLMISGDAHMLAFDNGTHTDYSTSRAGGFPLFHAAAIDRPASIKGGPYTGPVLPGGGQFGTVEIHDDGTRVAVALTGRDWQSRRLFTANLDFPPGG